MRSEPCFAKIITGFANYNRCRFFFFFTLFIFQVIIRMSMPYKPASFFNLNRLNRLNFLMFLYFSLPLTFN